MKKISHVLEYAAVVMFIKLACVLPLRAALFVGRVIGRAGFSLARVRREVAIRNLTDAMGSGKDAGEIRRIARRSFENIGQSMLEFGRLPVTNAAVLRKLVRLDGADNMRDAMAAGKGGIVVAGHFGSWEVMGASLAAYGFPMSFLVGRQTNQLVDRLMNRCRESAGVKLIPIGMAMRRVLRTLEANEFVAMLSDQDAGNEGVFVDFFGRKASTPFGPAAFSLRTGSPIIVISTVREKNGTHCVIIEKPIYPESTGDRQADLIKYTQIYTSIIERYASIHPDHWFWLHRRWKTRPPGEKRPGLES